MSPLQSILYDLQYAAGALLDRLPPWVGRAFFLRSAPPERYVEFREWLSTRNRAEATSVNLSPARQAEIKDKLYERVQITNTSPPGEIAFNRCFFNELAVLDNSKVRLRLIDCYVQKLELYDRCLNDLHIEGGSLLSISAPVSTAAAENPFRGRVTIRNVYIPRSYAEIRPQAEKGSRESAVYEFRNVRNLLAAKNDVLAAAVFHGVELSLERQDDRLPARLVGWVYEVTSDYGNSTTRPLWAFLMIAGFMAIIVGRFDLVEPTDVKALYGWQEQLTSADLRGCILRGITYTLQSIFNPLGLLASKPLLVAKHWAAAGLLMILGLLGTLAVAMFFLALRRRFKLD